MLKEMRVALGATAVMGLFGIAGLVGPSAPTGATGTMEADPMTVPQGGSTEISSVTPCPGYESVMVGSEGIPGSGSTEDVDGDGHWSATIDIPAGQEPGAYIVSASCVGPILEAGAGLVAPAQSQEWPYAPITINVVAQETTTTTTAPTTTTTAPPAAAPAVVAAPTYTG